MPDAPSPLGSGEDPTELIQQAAAGDSSAAARLLPMVYERLRGLAAVYVRGQPEHTLQATALAHEAYLKLIAAWSPSGGPDGPSEVAGAPKDREHLLAIAARAMRQILADHVRSRMTLKRGGGRGRVSLDAIEDPSRASAGDRDDDGLLALHNALERLAKADPRRYRVVELRFLGGLSTDETAKALGVSPRTVEGDWRVARLWLQGALRGEE
jgi:RNA polymerase sigma factor (TIGR02999 family)